MICPKCGAAMDGRLEEHVEVHVCWTCGMRIYPTPAEHRKMEINEIQKMTEEYSKDRATLSAIVRDVEMEIEKLKRKAMPYIKKALGRVVESREALAAAIEESPELFVKPKTRVFNGVKIGYRKQKGEITWEDEARVIKLIEKYFPDDAHEGIGLLRERVSVDKTAIIKLSAADIKRLGITIQEDTDEVVIAPVDSEVEKIVDALLKGAEDAKEAA